MLFFEFLVLFSQLMFALSSETCVLRSVANALRFVRVLLHTCSKVLLFIAKTVFLFKTANRLVLFSIYSTLLN